MSINISTDDNDAADVEPEKSHLKVYKQRLHELAKLLKDVYALANMYKINQKLTENGRIPIFVNLNSFICKIACFVPILAFNEPLLKLI